MIDLVSNKTLELVDLLTNQPLSNYLDNNDVKISFNNTDINVELTKPVEETIIKVQGIISGDSIEMTVKTSSLLESSPEEKIELAYIVDGTIRYSNPYEATLYKEERNELSYYDELGLIRTDKKNLIKSTETLDCTNNDNLLETNFIKRAHNNCKKYII